MILYITDGLSMEKAKSPATITLTDKNKIDETTNVLQFLLILFCLL